jgi:hypothetical protein
MTNDFVAAVQKLVALIDRQELSGLITRDLIRAKDELRLLLTREIAKEKK